MFQGVHEPWRGQQFADPPQLEELLKDLNGVSGLREEDGDGDSDTDFEPSIPPSNDMESSCAGALIDWETLIASQTLAAA